MIRTLCTAALAACLAATAGCSLLSTPDPVQMYRFGAPAAAWDLPASARTVNIALRRVEFPQAVASERILGVTGTEAAYIAGARWVGPARTLYSDSLESAFAASDGAVRLVGQREITPGIRLLDIDVQTFEAQYDAPGAAPVVVVSIRARMLELNRTIAAERRFQARIPTTENRVGAIVTAFDTAVAQVNGEIVEWTEASALLPAAD